MSDGPTPSLPASIIERFVQEREGWSDAEILEELKGFPPLPGEEAFNQAAANWRDVYRFVALADVCAARKLRPAVVMLLERASFGDPGETMRGLRHHLERIAEPDWDFLTDACLEALNSPQPGARYWAVQQLGIMQVERTLGALQGALDDPEAEIRSEAQIAIDGFSWQPSTPKRPRRQ